MHHQLQMSWLCFQGKHQNPQENFRQPKFLPLFKSAESGTAASYTSHTPRYTADTGPEWYSVSLTSFYEEFEQIASLLLKLLFLVRKQHHECSHRLQPTDSVQWPSLCSTLSFSSGKIPKYFDSDLGMGESKIQCHKTFDNKAILEQNNLIASF